MSTIKQKEVESNFGYHSQILPNLTL